MVPHENRVCGIHLNGKFFSNEALELITATKHGVLMSDSDLANWMMDLRMMYKEGISNRRRYNFDDPTNVSEDDYPNLVGFTKIQFDVLLMELSGHVHNSSNRSQRNALAVFLMFMRHDLSQVKKYKYKICT